MAGRQPFSGLDSNKGVTMRNRCLVALAVVLIAALAIEEAQARPRGRRGGTANGAAAPAGNVRQNGVLRQNGQLRQGIRNLGGKLGDAVQSGKFNDAINSVLGGGAKMPQTAGTHYQAGASQLKTNFTAANRPFTASWYAGHPQAWRYTHPHADAWAVASFATAAAWLGGGAYVDETYTSDESTDGTTADAATTDGDYLSLGVFGLAPRNAEDASALVQLAVDKQGQLEGNYYDVLTGQDQVVTGSIDQQTQLATFKVTPGGKVTYETTLVSLTQPTGQVTLRFDNGQTQNWIMARFDQAETQANQQTGPANP